MFHTVEWTVIPPSSPRIESHQLVIANSIATLYDSSTMTFALMIVPQELFSPGVLHDDLMWTSVPQLGTSHHMAP